MRPKGRPPEVRHLRGDHRRALGSGSGCKPGSKALLAESVRRRCPSEVPTNSRWGRKARRTGARAGQAPRSQPRSHRKSTRVAENRCPCFGANRREFNGRGTASVEVANKPSGFAASSKPEPSASSANATGPYGARPRQGAPGRSKHRQPERFRPPQPGSSSPTDRHHFQLLELARSSPALRGPPMTSVPPAKSGFLRKPFTMKASGARPLPSGSERGGRVRAIGLLGG